MQSPNSYIRGKMINNANFSNISEMNRHHSRNTTMMNTYSNHFLDIKLDKDLKHNNYSP